MNSLVDKKLEDARKLYMANIPLTDISAELGIKLTTLRKAAFGNDEKMTDPDCWANNRIETSEDFELARPLLIKKAQSKLLKRILAGTDEVEIEDVSDLAKATDIFDKLYKIDRLEKGESTENIDISAHGMTLREVMEAQYREIEDEEEEDEGILQENV